MPSSAIKKVLDWIFEGDRRRLGRLIELTDMPLYQAIGITTMLDLLLGRYGPGLGGATDVEIERILGWDGQLGALVPMLLAAGLLVRDQPDGGVRVRALVERS